jgi:hypothetical protein
MGGHSVPEDKIRERYVRCLELAREAVAHSYRAYFFLMVSGVGSDLGLCEFAIKNSAGTLDVQTGRRDRKSESGHAYSCVGLSMANSHQASWAEWLVAG